MTQKLKNPLKAISQRVDKAKRVTSVSSFEKLMQLVGDLNKHIKLHGIDHFVNQKYHPLERILWFALVVAAFFGVFYIGNKQAERYRANPTVISLERGTFIVP